MNIKYKFIKNKTNSRGTLTIFRNGERIKTYRSVDSDYWDCITIDGQLYDINYFHGLGSGNSGCSIYPVIDGNVNYSKFIKIIKSMRSK
jgi:hypothetical protein